MNWNWFRRCNGNNCCYFCFFFGLLMKMKTHALLIWREAYKTVREKAIQRSRGMRPTTMSDKEGKGKQRYGLPKIVSTS